MTPALYNINIPQNATYELIFQFKDSTGTPMDMNGYTVLAQVWNSNKQKKLAEFTTVWENITLGKVKLVLDYEDTANVSMVGNWDLLIIYPDGTKDYWVRGKAALAVGYTVNG